MPRSASAVALERSELLDALLAKLPEAQADALRLRFFGGLKFHEIAEAMVPLAQRMRAECGLEETAAADGSSSV